MKKFSDSELILTDRGSVYHLDLTPDEIGDIIITVGDPRRVKRVSQYFDSVDIKRKKREFKTHTGMLNGKRISVISTGIGTDNIDIVLNELDALVNIDLENKVEKETKKSLDIIRIGTSGALQEDIPVSSFVANTHAIGIDALGLYYDNSSNYLQLEKAKYFPHYITKSDSNLFDSICRRMDYHGIGITSCGFYGPQGRNLRIKNNADEFLESIRQVTIEERRVTNMEMETAGIFLLAEKLGHRAVSCNAILANRITKEFCDAPGNAVDRLIRHVLQNI